jgi:hypothetical protein
LAARGGRFFYVVLTAFVMISAIMVSYTRARAESLIGSCVLDSWSATNARIPKSKQHPKLFALP